MIKKITSVIYILLFAGVFASTLNQQSYFVDWISTFTVLLFLISSIGDAFNIKLPTSLRSGNCGGRIKLGKKTNWQWTWVLAVIYNLVYILYLDHKYGAQHGSATSDLIGFLIFAPVIYLSFHYAFSKGSKKAKNKTSEWLRASLTKIIAAVRRNIDTDNVTKEDQNEPYIIVGLRKLKSILESDWHLPPSTIVMESAVANNRTPTYEGPEQDYEQIATHILEFESLSDNNKLTKSTIESYQKQLDKISAKYVYDEPLGYLYCGFYELQAFIHKAEGDNKAAIKFLTEAADIKPHGLDFVSHAAQEWYSQELEKAVALSNEMYKQSMKKQRKFSKRAKITAWSVVGVVVLLIVLANPISDYLTIKDANPTMLKLARDADMTRKGELLFLRTNPQLVNDTQLAQFCPDAQTNNSGFIEQGCFVPNQSDPTTGRIYLRQMSSDLYDLEVTSAAYEMLHTAYAGLIINSSSALNSDIESNYASVNDPTIAADVALFAKTEPGARDDELFSMLGTSDYDSLSTSLQSYYTPYLNNPDIVVGDNNQVNALFQNDQTQLKQLNDTLNTDNITINNILDEANTAYADSVSWANAGNAYEDNYNYNIYSQDYNIYSQDVDDYNNTVDQYNQTLQDYEKLVTEYNGQQFNEASPIQSQQQQSQ